MKITDAWVYDPLMSGVSERPILCIEVDSRPDVSIEPTTFEGGWTVGKYGPFVKYEHVGSPADAGDFNVRFRNRFPAVVDVEMLIGGVANLGFSFNVGRARQLLRKHDPQWSLQVDDRAALNGSILWVPVQSNPGCRWWRNDSTCGVPSVRRVLIGEVDTPLCSEHVTEHNEKYARRRLDATSK